MQSIRFFLSEDSMKLPYIWLHIILKKLKNPNYYAETIAGFRLAMLSIVRI
jgi:hypothetical protein